MEDDDSGDVSQTFGLQVREARSDMGMSQRLLASRMGSLGFKLDPSAITRIESGKREVKLAEAVALKEILGLNLDALSADRAAPFRSRVARWKKAMMDARESLVEAMDAFDTAHAALTDDLAADLLATSPVDSVADYFAVTTNSVKAWSESPLANVSTHSDELSHELKLKVIEAVSYGTLLSEAEVVERRKRKRGTREILGLHFNEE